MRSVITSGQIGDQQGFYLLYDFKGMERTQLQYCDWSYGWAVLSQDHLAGVA